MKFKFLIAVLAVSALVAACGSDSGGHAGHAASGNGDAVRTVKVEMRDIEYSISTLDVAKGDTIKFEFTNTGKLEHDAFIGDESAQSEHESSMMEDGAMDHHSDANALTVKPGKTGSLTHTFDAAGETVIGCHEAGHYAGGMKIVVKVA